MAWPLATTGGVARCGKKWSTAGDHR